MGVQNCLIMMKMVAVVNANNLGMILNLIGFESERNLRMEHLKFLTSLILSLPWIQRPTKGLASFPSDVWLGYCILLGSTDLLVTTHFGKESLTTNCKKFTNTRDPYSSVGKRSSFAVRRLLVCIQQGVSVILCPLNNREMPRLGTKYVLGKVPPGG